MRTYKWSGVSIDGLDNLKRWLDAMYQRPGVLRGKDVPVKVDNLLEGENKDAADEFVKGARNIVGR